MIELARRRYMGKSRYIYVEYIENSSRARTELPIGPYTNFSVELDVYFGNSGTGITVFGSRNSSGKGTYFGTGGAQQYVRYDYNGVRKEDTSYSVLNKRVKVTIHDGNLAIFENGILKSTLNITSTASITPNYNWYLFALNLAGGSGGLFIGKIYAFKAVVGGVTYDYKPAYDTEENTYGIYDEAHDDFRSSISSEPFTGGAPI